MPPKNLEWITAYVAFGSNLGDRRRNIETAAAQLRDNAHIRALTLSPLIETAPVGGPPQDDYLNAVAVLETDLSARELLRELQYVEAKAGRTREIRWGPRTIDLDILFYGQWVIDEPGLIVPHPRLHERSFVLEPLCTIDPDYQHPVLQRTARELLADLPSA